jgi:GGDEF domain-containing protein
VFPIGTTREGVDAALRRLVHNIGVFNNSGKRRYELSVSVGISVYDPRTPSSIDDLVMKADKAMYEQKARKKEGGAR